MPRYYVLVWSEGASIPLDGAGTAVTFAADRVVDAEDEFEAAGLAMSKVVEDLDHQWGVGGYGLGDLRIENLERVDDDAVASRSNKGFSFVLAQKRPWVLQLLSWIRHGIARPWFPPKEPD